MLIVQFVALIAAAAAYWQLSRQLHLQREQLSLQRDEMHNSLRPLVVIQRARLVRRADAHYYIQVVVENVGPGPAQQIQVLAWPRALRELNVAPAARAQMDLVKAEVSRDRLDAPEFLLRLGALASGQQRIEFMAVTDTVAPDIPPYEGFLVYLTKYVDVYERSFPSKPRRAWEAGHIWMEPPRN